MQAQIKIEKLGPCAANEMISAARSPLKVTFVPASILITVASDEDAAVPAIYTFQVEFSSRPAPWNKTPRRNVATVHFRLPETQLRVSHPSDLPFIALQ